MEREGEPAASTCSDVHSLRVLTAGSIHVEMVARLKCPVLEPVWGRHFLLWKK